MGNADTSEIARNAARTRWGNRVALQAAELVIARADELPGDVAAVVHARTAPQPVPEPGEGEQG